VSDDSLLWTYKPPPAKARPGEPLFTLIRDEQRISCELRYHGEYGVEAQFLRDGELMIGRRFVTRSPAVQWGRLERYALLREGRP
jgi:hypothetical protein